MYFIYTYLGYNALLFYQTRSIMLATPQESLPEDTHSEECKTTDVAEEEKAQAADDLETDYFIRSIFHKIKEVNPHLAGLSYDSFGTTEPFQKDTCISLAENSLIKLFGCMGKEIKEGDLPRFPLVREYLYFVPSHYHAVYSNLNYVYLYWDKNIDEFYYLRKNQEHYLLSEAVKNIHANLREQFDKLKDQPELCTQNAMYAAVFSETSMKKHTLPPTKRDIQNDFLIYIYGNIFKIISILNNNISFEDQQAKDRCLKESVSILLPFLSIVRTKLPNVMRYMLNPGQKERQIIYHLISAAIRMLQHINDDA